MEKDLAFKVCIFGESGVGKSTLAQCFLTGAFDPKIQKTLGAAIHVKFLIIKKAKVTLQIWDFGGEERFRFLLPVYARGAYGGIFMFDLTREYTLENVEEWINIFRRSSMEGGSGNPLLLVGGKSDLVGSREVKSKKGENLAKKFNFDHYFECSSKTLENVEEIFLTLVNLILKKSNILED